MTSTPLHFSDIQTSDLLYYDPDFKEVCLRFCQDRNIDCLPSLHDPMKYFQRNENGFIEKSVTSDRMVDCQEFVFNESSLNRFRDNYLLFVYEGKDLTGVVHFSDYNRPAVTEFLFSQLSAYERSLRKLLLECGLKNQDMLDYFQKMVKTTKKENRKLFYGRKIEEYERLRDRNEKLPDFERFYLKDLIELVNEKKIVVINEDVNELRNDIMHVHDLVTMHDAHRDDYIYNFTSFEKFFGQVRKLLLDFKRVNNKIAFMELKG